MRKAVTSIILGAVLVAGGIGSAEESHALDLAPYQSFAYQYGDFNSYSLPILAYYYSQAAGVGEGPGNPYYIASSPGQIANSIVVATGNKEQNFTGMDWAYLTPNKVSAASFSTGTSPDPDTQLSVADGNQTGTWDSTIAAFTSYLNGTTPIFLFNNNETDGAQNLYAWGRMTIRDSDGGAAPIMFDFTNTNTGGVQFYTSTGAEPGTADYVLSGGEVVLPIGPGGTNVKFEHNLGANQAAYALVSPELNAFLTGWNSDSPYDVLSIDLRLRDIDNGFEQLFIVRSDYTPPVPEPGTIALVGAGLAVVALGARKRRK